jgi:hypothetical protein
MLVIEDVRTHLKELLVATDVEIHWTLCEYVRSLSMN